MLESRAVYTLILAFGPQPHRAPCRCKALQTGRWHGDTACTPSLSQSLTGGLGHSDLL